MEYLARLHTFRAFRSFNFTLYFFGRSVSQFGTWMQRTAVVWVVYSLTHSTFLLGLTIFAEQFPSFLLSVFGGIASDRYNLRKIINLTQVISMVQACLLALLMITGHYFIWEILALSVVLGIVNAFDVPARQALIHEVLYDKADLPNALSLSATMASVARLLGPVASGLLLEKFGAGVCFLLNAASFGAVMLSLWFMKLPPYVPSRKKKKVLAELVEGFLYLKKVPSLGFVMLVLTAVSLLVIPYDTLLPVYAKVIFKGNAATFGYITSFIGLGAVAATIFLASLKKGADMKKLLLVSTAVLGAGLAAFSHAKSFPLAMLFAVAAGFGTVAQNTISNIIIQSESASYMRGRAISIMVMAMFGLLPIGSLLIGAVSQKIGAPDAILCQGIAGLLIALVAYRFLRRHRLNKNMPEALPEEEETIIEHS